MSYPQTVIDQIINHSDILDDDNLTILRAAYSETVRAHSVIEIELTSGQNYLIHIENVETFLDALKHTLDVNEVPITPIGADIGSWCIKKLDGKPVYGLLASEDGSGRYVCRLYQSQLDRLKILSTIIFRDKDSGIVLDVTSVQNIS